MVKEHFLTHLQQQLHFQDELLEQIEQGQGELSDELHAAVLHNTKDIKKAVDLCAELQEKLEMSASFYKAKADQYKNMAERYRNQADGVKNLITKVMSENNKKSLTGHSREFKLTERNDFRIEIENPDLVPDQFRVTKTTSTPSKTLIKSHINDLGLNWKDVQISGVALHPSTMLKTKDVIRKLK